jgi:hypothetical protein
MPESVSPRAIAQKLHEFWSPRVVAALDDTYVKVRHNRVAEQECYILLIERKTTRHTGDVKTERTRSLADQLRPV